MKKINYETKELKTSYESKDLKTIIHPAGHIYHFNHKDMMTLLKMNGYDSIDDAKDNGWRFK